MKNELDLNATCTLESMIDLAIDQLRLASESKANGKPEFFDMYVEREVFVENMIVELFNVKLADVLEAIEKRTEKGEE